MGCRGPRGKSGGQGKVLGGWGGGGSSQQPPPTDPGPRNFQRLLPGRERVEKEPESGRESGTGWQSHRRGGGQGGGDRRGGGTPYHMSPPSCNGAGGRDGGGWTEGPSPRHPQWGDLGGGVRGPPPGPHGPSGTAGTVVVPPVPVPVPPPRGINSPGAACGGHGAKNSPGGTVVAGACRGHPSTAQYTQYGPVHPVTVAQQLPVLHSPSSSPVRSPSHSPQ